MEDSQKSKFKSDIRFAKYVACLMSDGTKQFVSCYTWENKDGFNNPNIERELNPIEYMDFIKKNGIKVLAWISRWDNIPTQIIRIEQGTDLAPQPFIVDRITDSFPNGHGMRLCNYKLKVENPTEFWHHKFNK
jgi:hypothetical protein